jgi:ligand-binding sensor domain-containing protein/two-component sensor histidine kinase
MVGRRRLIGALALLGAIVIASVTDVEAARLPTRRYTSADGLASDYTIGIYRDSRGFLWFSTRDGLSRFDGVRFTSYGIRDGLPATTINDVLETRAGVYWIATNGGGVCRFNPRAQRAPAGRSSNASRQGAVKDERLFEQFRVGDEPAMNRVNVVYEDGQRRVWVGTDAGLFRLDVENAAVTFTRVVLALLPPSPTFHGVNTIGEDAEGSLWIAGGFGLRRHLPDGRTVIYSAQPGGAREIVNTLLVGKGNELWVGLRSGLVKLEAGSASSFASAPDPIVRTLRRARHPDNPLSDETRSSDNSRWYDTRNGLAHDNVTALHQSSDGHVWVGTAAGLSEFDGRQFRGYTTANGLADDYIMAIKDDVAGNLWIGTVAGVTRILGHGLLTFDQRDGLPSLRIHSIGETDSGRLFAVSGDYAISEFDGERFISSRPNLPRAATCSWLSRCAYMDGKGEWWVLSTTGLYRLPRVEGVTELARHRPRVAYSARDGLPVEAFQIFEDRHWNIWLGTAPEGLAQWQRSTGAWRVYSSIDGLPTTTGMLNMASAFAEDRAGQVWVGFYNGGVARWANGRFQMFGVADGVPAGLITALHVDDTGRLWMGSNQSGLASVDDPAAARPTFKAQPAISGNVRSLTDDATGHLYAGTSRGIDRLDPRTSTVRHFGTGEGLASDFVTAAFRDSHGMLWFGTISGLSRLDPAAEGTSSSHSPSPQVLISAVRVRGVPQPIAELGDPEPSKLILSPDQNQLEIEFFAMTFQAGDSLKYQYRIDGIDADWSPPTELRSVNYGRLPAGSHRFLVRSLRSDGATSAAPAVLSFVVLPPLYARWWFISLAALLIGAAIVTFYRMRVAQLLRVERVRARIATDLHDDIGASLSQIAILAEVAQQSTGATERDPSGPLNRIAETSRGLVDSMSDIVWAINPEVDSLSDLVHRMRRFAEDTLGAYDIDLTFDAPDPRQDPSLGPQVRREIFLILKESVTNIAKHADCHQVTIELECDRRRLRLRVSDDGKGFDPAQRTDGNGVANMRRRVAALGGRLTLHSAPGRGTTVEVDVPFEGST